MVEKTRLSVRFSLPAGLTALQTEMNLSDRRKKQEDYHINISIHSKGDPTLTRYVHVFHPALIISKQIHTHASVLLRVKLSGLQQMSRFLAGPLAKMSEATNEHMMVHNKVLAKTTFKNSRKVPTV